jgi:hypothetical protein
MQDGINKIADAVAVTLGPRGKFLKPLLAISYVNCHLICIYHIEFGYIVAII